ncbi:hypothetical protein CAPTEDRAFT_223938 [Capitella teleta]|uniref:Aldose 1-epimerase n=1 Tax=Capitella teleta TaxID=283909 RepID=R7TF47_CAPTE|nr:hypothetical protein CAPTEDRAFT_223938 [Capitella teleta]|eukprot:ELT90176.1 hypothetical protein CAPTEDRAFT_223938 [Capitella teleta]
MDWIRTFFAKTYKNDAKFQMVFILSNSHGSSARIIDLGGTITHLSVPDKNGKFSDVILGFDTLSQYETDDSYFGSLVGRFAGRIASGQFTLNGQQHEVTTNNANNTLHGGKVGWNRAIWNAKIEGDRLVLSHVSQDGDQGFPGEVHVTAAIRLTDDNELQINMTAVAKKKATPINLTSHPYFNLAGKGSIADHHVTIFADYYNPGNPDVTPTGEIAPVSGTIFDFTSSRRLGDVLHNVSVDNVTPGYDHNFCVRGATGRRRIAEVNFAFRVHEPETGRLMQVFSNQPGLMFYTGNFISVEKGKGGQSYGMHGAFCMEPQGYPDAINQENFPDCVLYPGSTYVNEMAFRFSVL